MCPGTPGEISRGGPLEVQNGTQQDRNKMIHLVNFGGKKIVYMLKMGGFEMEDNKIWLNGRHGQIWGGKKIVQMPKMGGKTATHTYWLSKRECPPREQIPGLADSWWPPLTHWLRPRQNGQHFQDDIYKCVSLYKNVWISIKVSLKFVPNVPINNIPALVQKMAWRRPGDKPLSEPMMDSLPMHICVTRPQWVKEPEARLLSYKNPPMIPIPISDHETSPSKSNWVSSLFQRANIYQWGTLQIPIKIELCLLPTETVRQNQWHNWTTDGHIKMRTIYNRTLTIGSRFEQIRISKLISRCHSAHTFN